MHKLRKFYYDNKYKIWGIIAFIILLIGIIQVTNAILANNNKLNNNTVEKNVIENINSENKDTYFSTDESVVSGEKIDSNKLEKASKAIEEFISECNNGNIEKAYNLLTDDCKNEMYQDIEKFTNYYYNQIFNNNTKKTAIIENWILNTYKVTISDDIMATGGVSTTNVQDYITVIEDDDILKISLNNYIGKEEINKVQVVNDIEFEIVEKDVYMDYEIYTIKVNNNTENNIVLDDLTNTKSIYLEDNNGVKHYAKSSEIIPNLLKINKGFSTQIDIKFNRTLTDESIEINSIVFSAVKFNTNQEEQQKQVIKIDL